MSDIFFISADGNKIYADGINSHIGLANFMINNDEELKIQFEESGKIDPVDFLVEDRGYVKVSDLDSYHVVTFSSDNVSNVQRRIIVALYEDGYYVDNIAKYKKKTNDREI